jgi:hypothetical protein
MISDVGLESVGGPVDGDEDNLRQTPTARGLRGGLRS